jgi:hypothetical protein
MVLIMLALFRWAEVQIAQASPPWTSAGQEFISANWQRLDDSEMAVAHGLQEEILKRPLLTHADIAAKLEMAASYLDAPGDNHGSDLVGQLMDELRLAGGSPAA